MIRVLVMDTVMDRGGAETMIMNYYRKIDRSKVQFDFLVHREYKAAYEDEILSLGGKIYRICPPYPHNYFKYKKRFREVLQEYPYKIIHSNMMELGLFGYKFASKKGVPIIICHSHTSELNKKTSICDIKSKIRNFYKKRLINYVTHYFACGEQATISLFGETNIKNTVILPNAINCKDYIYDENIDYKIRKQYGLTNSFVIGHVGRFFTPKNHSFIIDIFFELTKMDDTAKLVLVGGGEIDNANMNIIKDKVKQLNIEDKVIFTGVVDNVNEIIQSFDIFILPSLQEGFPVVMVEAQTAGLKCLISENVPIECDLTGNVEVIKLSDGAKAWANRIFELKNSYKKQNMLDVMINKNFDINSNAKWLQNYYYEELQKLESKE